MTATELFEALKGVPEEALCKTLTFNSNSITQWWEDSRQHPTRNFNHDIEDDIAAALQRDAMTEWLDKWQNANVQWSPRVLWLANERSWWAVMEFDRSGCDTIGQYPTRLHALAAACRFVAEVG
jgi:hypothetical protein